MDEYGLTTMELGSVGYKDDQWVLANRVIQVAYYPKLRDSKKHVVVSRKQRIVRGGPTCIHGYSVEYPKILAKKLYT